jgi:antibiotic biosynthesis monooxygenase (ABM) superfamily enzyme
MEKRPAGRGLFALVLSFRYTVTLSAYLPSARRRLMTERSERMSEEAENHQNVQ